MRKSKLDRSVATRPATSAAILAAALAYGALACDSGAPAAPADAKGFGTAALDAICESYVRCGGFPDRATCTAKLTAVGFLVDIAAIEQAIAAGRVSYNANNAARCLELSRGVACELSQLGGVMGERACASVFEGKIAPGGACRLPEECAGGTCEINFATCPGRNMCCQGKCVTLGALGASCMGGGACQPGLTCLDGKCAEMPVLGQRCAGICEKAVCDIKKFICVAPAAIGQPCGDTGCDRVFDATCNRDGVCEKWATLGQPCGKAECAPYLRCAAGVCAAQSATNETCQIDLDCVSDVCGPQGQPGPKACEAPAVAPTCPALPPA